MSTHTLAIACAIVALVVTPLYLVLGVLGVRRLGRLSSRLGRPARRAVPGALPGQEDRRPE